MKLTNLLSLLSLAGSLVAAQSHPEVQRCQEAGFADTPHAFKRPNFCQVDCL